MLGFALLQSAECPRLVLQLLLSRFPQAPRLIIYDNACNLHKLCMKIAPTFFQNTIFVVDRLHEPGHVSCSPAFCMRYHRHLINVNSQVAEEGNSYLSGSDIISCISMMTQSNFLRSMRLWMLMYNIRVHASGSVHFRSQEPFLIQLQKMS
jgi:hypothetical protein